MDLLQAPPRGVIFDLGDVLLTWSATTTTTIPPRKLLELFSSPIWHGYERGEITRDDCYELSARQFSLSTSEITEAFAQARESITPDQNIISLLRELKKDPAIKVYAMSNMGKEDFDDFEGIMDWSLFDDVFISATAGMRKPDPNFYRHVLSHIGLEGHQTIFIDDKEENVRAAQALDMRGLVFEESTVHVLRETFTSPVGMGWRYLFNNSKKCDSFTNVGVTFEDTFAKLLSADLLQDPALSGLSWGSRTTWNYFANGEAPLMPEGYLPDDLDTTSLAMMLFRPPAKTVSYLLDMMTEWISDDGIFPTYFDRGKVRIDPVINANILACYYTYNRGREFERALQFVRSMLLDRSYLPHGTYYYSTPDCCLGFVGRLLRSSNDVHLHTTLGPLFKSRVHERVGAEGSSLDLAFRIMTCTQMGIACEVDRRALLDLQCEDGSWGDGWVYRYGKKGVQIGNRGLTTATAVAALSAQSPVVQEVDAYEPDGIDKGLHLMNGQQGSVREVVS